jgi:hypothetical protein
MKVSESAKPTKARLSRADFTSGRQSGAMRSISPDN